MHIDGITWHALTLDETQFTAWNKLARETLGLTPMMEMPGVSVFQMPNGTILELYTPHTVPAYGYNEGGVAFGFRVEDIDAASKAVEAAGCELLGEVTRVEDMGYAYRHFRGPDGRVYGLNEQKTPAAK
ncbi:MAG TPA: VOC family protein [Gemmatimonadales bacterium]|nr:VOC family protein [Gemmatimonadales bacterium]